MKQSTASNPPEGNPLGNNAAQSLAMVGLVKLMSLYMIFQLIQNCSNLHHFKIADCQLDCNGMTLLSKSLISTKSLETLDLRYIPLKNAIYSWYCNEIVTILLVMKVLQN